MNSAPNFFSQNQIRPQNPFPQQNQNIVSGKTPKKFSLATVIIVAIVSVIASSATTLFITSLNPNKSTIFSDEEEPEISDADVKTVIHTDGSESADDVLKQLDEKINSDSSSPSDNFDDIMTKVAFLFDFEKYDEAKSTLDGISQDNLTNFQLFQIYSYYARYYSQIGDTSNATAYEKKASEAETKYISE